MITVSSISQNRYAPTRRQQRSAQSIFSSHVSLFLCDENPFIRRQRGNLIFRYFIEWLRIEMREEAFQGYVKRAKRKAQTLKKQQQQQQQYQQQYKNKQKNPTQQDQKLADSDPSWTSSYMPGWVTSTLADVSAEVDEWYDWLTEEEKDRRESDSKGDQSNGSTGNNGDDDDDDIDYRQTQLWEVAKIEGDEKWIEWLHTHIWSVSL